MPIKKEIIDGEIVTYKTKFKNELIDGEMVTYKAKFIDTFRFMRSSLSGLVETCLKLILKIAIHAEREKKLNQNANLLG